MIARRVVPPLGRAAFALVVPSLPGGAARLAARSRAGIQPRPVPAGSLGSGGRLGAPHPLPICTVSMILVEQAPRIRASAAAARPSTAEARA